MKAAPHPGAEPVWFGTPRPLPRILFCHVPAPSPMSARTRWCGRLWAANTPEQYAEHAQTREAHHRLCGSLAAAVAGRG